MNVNCEEHTFQNWGWRDFLVSRRNDVAYVTARKVDARI
jgi:hypothetical protein